ncbi:MAG TPA: hypothetical protein PK286_07415 [Devosia sp.]|nr:hypothetical protein [Devosia sp.]
MLNPPGNDLPTERQRIAVAAFAVVWVGILLWGNINGFLARQSAEARISETDEYQCIEAALGKKPRLQWRGSRTPPGYLVGTLSEQKGTNCIESGVAISFALLAEGPGKELSLVRFKGREPKLDFRESGQLPDVTDASGRERWRNDGSGYRRIAP